MFSGRLKKLILGKGISKQNKQLEFGQVSFAQEGEDLLLDRLLNGKKSGFYVDIGAHHPMRFSNTHYFYQRGWKGINIDAMPGSMVQFNLDRPADINLEMGVSNSSKELVYYVFNEPALNTFSETEAKKKDGLKTYKIIDRIKIMTYQLTEILDKHLHEEQKIDFMTIDVEGLDLEVLNSNNWEKYRPYWILVESLQKWSISELPEKSKVYQTLVANGYQWEAKTLNTLFFKDSRN